MARTFRRKELDANGYTKNIHRDMDNWNMAKKAAKEGSKKSCRANSRQFTYRSLVNPDTDYVFYDRKKDYDDIWNYD